MTSTRRTIVTDEELDRWNHMRERAGQPPIGKDMAEAILSKVNDVTYQGMMEMLKR